MATNFSTRYKKDLSTETLKTKLVHRKSLHQKESRYKEFNRGRQFGPIDVNTQRTVTLAGGKRKITLQMDRLHQGSHGCPAFTRPEQIC
uniref:Uncharacterized protein n=1 Tax=Anolis carolinensis TaxID=28377 RepID=A0A803TC10_ANOCA